jgi:hypothetical protein
MRYMRRAKVVLAALTVVVSTFAAFSGPAMADDLNCRDAWGNLIRCDGQYYAPVSNSWDNNWDNGWGWNSGWGWNNGWNNWGAAQNCPYWGDTEGIVNQSDCFG